MDEEGGGDVGGDDENQEEEENKEEGKQQKGGNKAKNDQEKENQDIKLGKNGRGGIQNQIPNLGQIKNRLQNDEKKDKELVENLQADNGRPQTAKDLEKERAARLEQEQELNIKLQREEILQLENTEGISQSKDFIGYYIGFVQTFKRAFIISRTIIEKEIETLKQVDFNAEQNHEDYIMFLGIDFENIIEMTREPYQVINIKLRALTLESLSKMGQEKIQKLVHDIAQQMIFEVRQPVIEKLNMNYYNSKVKPWFALAQKVMTTVFGRRNQQLKPYKEEDFKEKQFAYRMGHRDAYHIICDLFFTGGFFVQAKQNSKLEELPDFVIQKVQEFEEKQKQIEMESKQCSLI